MSLHDIGLHPDLIDDVVEELFAMDVIGEDQLKKLKNDAMLADPNIMMDVRHKEVKKESLIDFDIKRNTTKTIKRRVENSPSTPIKPIKNLNVIDKEISNTKKCLEAFQNKLERKSELLKESIIELERKEFIFEDKTKNLERFSSEAEKFNDDETVHHFNLHLDRLENALKKNKPQNILEKWQPMESSSPTNNLITTLKDYEKTSTLLEDSEDDNLSSKYGLGIFDYDENFFEKSSGIQIKHLNNAAPSNTPTFNVNVTFNESLGNILTPNQHKIILQVINKWRLYVKRRKIQRWSEEKASKMRMALLRKYVSLWISYSKQNKMAKKLHLSKSSEGLEIVPTKCCINQKNIGCGNSHIKAESDSCQEQKQNNTDQVSSKCSPVKKRKLDLATSSKPIPLKSAKGKCFQTKLETTSDKSEVHVKTLTPQDVGLIQVCDGKSELCKKHVGKQLVEPKSNVMTSRSLGEPILHRFEAQEKIIRQQREVIEKQNRIIFDLQAKCFEMKSKVNQILAERQLAEAEILVSKGLVSCDKKLERKLESNRSKHNPNDKIVKNQDKSEVIVKNMLERQAYCSQLAEQTKLRKKRIEEEKQKLKLEQEEKEKQEKEEERRRRIHQIKMEQQLAQEKERNLIAQKKIESELFEKAINHYRIKLLQRTFSKLRSISLEVFIKAEDCDRIYRNKILRKIFNVWKDRVKLSIESKFKFAETYYNERLLRMAWGSLLKIHQDYKLRLQVSEDLYNLKLQERMFHRWQAFVTNQFLQQCCKMELAERLHRRQLLRRYFHHWKEIPKQMFKDREREQRRQAWRHTVQQLIPDFTPTYVDEM